MRTVAIAWALAACGSPAPPTASPPRAPLAHVAADAPPAPVADQDQETALATKRWVYATFFNRIKRQIGLAWHPAAVWNGLPTSVVANLGTKPRITETLIVLSPHGTLIAVDVLEASGVPELDAEAARAVRAVASFGEPPPELVHDGAIKFRFAFYFEIGSGTATASPIGVGTP